MPRLFTGLEIPAEVGQTLSNLRGGLPGARWIDPENYHVTLRFIGDIDGISANEIASMLFRVDRKPFEVKVQGLTSFGGRKPRAVVATIAPSKPLMELQAELERMMQRIGLNPEGRKFIPHVTLARLHDASDRDVADYLSLRGYFPSKAFMAERFNSIYPELARKFDVPLYPFFLDGVAADAKLNQADGIHPTAAGVDIVVDKMLPTVEAFVRTIGEQRR